MGVVYHSLNPLQKVVTAAATGGSGGEKAFPSKELKKDSDRPQYAKNIAERSPMPKDYENKPSKKGEPGVHIPFPSVITVSGQTFQRRLQTHKTWTRRPKEPVVTITCAVCVTRR